MSTTGSQLSEEASVLRYRPRLELSHSTVASAGKAVNSGVVSSMVMYWMCSA